MAQFAAAVRITLALSLVLAAALPALAGPFDEMALDRWAKLREVERYQLNIAEKLYRENQWKVAADEYEKFMKLYEQSEGAPFAQFKWSHCQVSQRKLNTAIKDGYQTVIDYFPDSPEAPLAAYFIGKTAMGMGDLKTAKKAYGKVLTSYPKHFVAVYSRSDLAEVAGKEHDLPRQLALLRELAYDTERKGPAARECAEAARLLARLSFYDGNFDEGVKALATTCKEEELYSHIMNHGLGRLAPISHELTGSSDEAVKKKGEKLAEAGIAFLKKQATGDLKDDTQRARALQCWFWIAEIHGYARKPDEQRKTYEQMLTLFGADPEINSRIGNWYRDHNKFDQAITFYRNLSLSDVKNVTRWLGELAYTYRRASKPDPAIAIYRDLIVSDPKNGPGYQWEIAETLYYAHRWAECITAYRGTERFPDNYSRMAEANRQLKKYDEAITLYRQIMAGNPSWSSWALLQIGYTQERAGQEEIAIKTFKQVCDKFPKTQAGSEAHSHLNQKYKITVTLGGAKD